MVSINEKKKFLHCNNRIEEFNSRGHSTCGNVIDIGSDCRVANYSANVNYGSLLYRKGNISRLIAIIRSRAAINEVDSKSMEPSRDPIISTSDDANERKFIEKPSYIYI